MSARNFLSAREKNHNKITDSLPSINKQKLSFRPERNLPISSAAPNQLFNRNLTYSFTDYENLERSGTPFSDFFSESETGTPDIRSEESDSSTGSVLRRNTAQVTKVLADEWEKIERTLYDEDGEKSARPQIIEECKQWRQLHPHLRVIGKALPLPERKLCYRQMEIEETIAMHYSDYGEFSEGDERHSESSTDITPQNSPRGSTMDEFLEPKLSREKVSFLPLYDQDSNLNGAFDSLLQITPLQMHIPLNKKKPQSILKSEIASSRWMRDCRPDSSNKVHRNSAKPFVSLDVKGIGNLIMSASERNSFTNTRVVTAKHRDVTRLEPLNTPEMNQSERPKLLNGVSQQCCIRKVSLPPLLLEEERSKLTIANSARKHITRSKKCAAKSFYHLDRVRHF